MAATSAMGRAAAGGLEAGAPQAVRRRFTRWLQFVDCALGAGVLSGRRRPASCRRSVWRCQKGLPLTPGSCFFAHGQRQPWADRRSVGNIGLRRSCPSVGGRGIWIVAYRRFMNTATRRWFCVGRLRRARPCGGLRWLVVVTLAAWWLAPGRAGRKEVRSVRSGRPFRGDRRCAWCCRRAIRVACAALMSVATDATS